MADIPPERVKLLHQSPEPDTPPPANMDPTLEVGHDCGFKVQVPLLCPGCGKPWHDGELDGQVAFALALLERRVARLEVGASRVLLATASTLGQDLADLRNSLAQGGKPPTSATHE